MRRSQQDSVTEQCFKITKNNLFNEFYLTQEKKTNIFIHKAVGIVKPLWYNREMHEFKQKMKYVKKFRNEKKEKTGTPLKEPSMYSLESILFHQIGK